MDMRGAEEAADLAEHYDRARIGMCWELSSLDVVRGEMDLAAGERARRVSSTT
jgi:hypothetical protein